MKVWRPEMVSLYRVLFFFKSYTRNCKGGNDSWVENLKDQNSRNSQTCRKVRNSHMANHYKAHTKLSSGIIRGKTKNQIMICKKGSAMLSFFQLVGAAELGAKPPKLRAKMQIGNIFPRQMKESTVMMVNI